MNTNGHYEGKRAAKARMRGRVIEMLKNFCFDSQFLVLAFSGFTFFPFYMLVAGDDCFSSYKEIPERALHGI